MPKILVVDDEQNMRTGLKDNLEFEGYDVETANDGEQGLKKILENYYNLIILGGVIILFILIGKYGIYFIISRVETKSYTGFIFKYFSLS